ncbi:MAG: hypothetical protein NVSMB19_21910 [Vulcanimicrobiaceae bacterium]
MKLRRRPGYHTGVPLNPSLRKHAPAFFLRHVLTLAFVAGAASAARAEVVTLDGTSAPIVHVTIRSGDVTIRTWDRASVEIDGEPSLTIVRRSLRQPADPSPVLIPRAEQRSREGLARLPAESFVVSTIPAGPRDAIFIKSSAETPAGHVIVTVPNDSVYVFAYARDGDLTVRDYRLGTFVGFTTHGRLALENVGGTIFAQTARGALVVADAALERMRARSLFGDITFERCRTRQIEATSVAGSIVYDSGSFEPGIARFESARGDVAIGARGAAQLGGHVAGEGRVYTNFEHGARISGARDDASALVGGGGPVVTATTQSGNVYLYDGSLRTRGHLPTPWRVPIGMISRKGVRRDEPQRPAGFAPPLQPQRAFATPRPFRFPFETPPAAAPRVEPVAAPHRPPERTHPSHE